jgi:hypothetical protein
MERGNGHSWQTVMPASIGEACEPIYSGQPVHARIRASDPATMQKGPRRP